MVYIVTDVPLEIAGVPIDEAFHACAISIYIQMRHWLLPVHLTHGLLFHS